ncbi:SIS domain-containing protein [Marinitoga sp. 38H-ov]|uniref:SIS domain-containing protein n=1 Tax=Marinitoga sp. 38H-ov TaxID=1755814 RepID=UPI0013EB86AB|nr:SIS domain-containing protein [Marinitoga sp. 38H-ov]KAF2956132.1 sugar isomerase [Marinitoga sp. 38H-ov]
MNYTLKEINRIPKLLSRVKDYNFKFEKNKKYTFIGCGSSYNLGLIVSKIMNKFGYNSNVISGGEVIVFDEVPKTDIAIFISRTGESTETVQAIERFKNIKTIGITCTSNSSLTKKCTENYIFDFANEESVVMTGSFVFILNFLLNGIEFHDYSNITILNNIKNLVDSIDLKNYNHFVFLGFNEQYGVAKESALKVQEMAMQNVEFHEPLEYRHGPKSTLTEKSLIVIYSKDTYEERVLANELRNMGAKIILVSEDGDLKIKYNNGFDSILRIILPQYIGFKKAILEGLDPDNPKNLSKSVILKR